MSDSRCRDELAASQELIRSLQEELAATNQGLVALTMELEQRVDDRTSELRAAQEELERTNSELLQLTLELEDRVAQRTAELQEKNEELVRLWQQNLQASKLATMGELAASIAHELNNPLATVSLRVEGMIAQIAEDDPRQRSLAIVAQEADRMANLVGNLLQFSRSTTQVCAVDLREEIDRAIELVHYRLRNHRISLVKDYAPQLPMIQADPQQMRQLFLNIVGNCIDAMRDNSEERTVTIRVASEDAGNGKGRSSRRIVLEFSDTGMGISQENLPKVMEPFFTTKPEGKGTGLGLAICRRIVSEHHGTIGVRSEQGKGTTIRMVLPANRETNSVSKPLEQVAT